MRICDLCFLIILLTLSILYTEKQTYAKTDPSHLIRIYTICRSENDFDENLYWETMDMSKL